jgi:hypothetical protein
MKPINLLKKIKEQSAELSKIWGMCQIGVGYEDENEEGNLTFYTEAAQTREFNEKLSQLLHRIKQL